MRIIFGLLGVYLALVVYGQIAMAIEPQSIIPQDVVQQTNRPSEPQIVEIPAGLDNALAQQTSVWDVSEFLRDNGAPTGKCLMRTEYNNNIEVTFKGKNGQLSALRIRDLNGAQGSSIKGFLAIGFDKKSYGLQSKSGQGQIDGSLLTVPAAAEKIIDLGQYRLRVGTQDYNFSAGEFAMAYQDLLKCTGYENARTMKVVNEPIYVPELNVVNVPTVPAEPVDVVIEQDLVNVDDVNNMVTDIKHDMVDENLSVRMETWKAYEGDKLSAVLKNWALQAGVQSQIDLTDDIALKNDVRVFGSLDVAVGQLLKDAYGESSPMATLQGRDGSITQIAELKESQEKQVSPKSRIVPTANWRALQGMDLRKILKRWSVREGVDFVWDADQIFLLKETTKSVTDYNTAVAMVLAQYDGQDVKPMATLNIDPNTGKKTLVVSVSGAS